MSEHPVLRATRWLGLNDPDPDLFDRYARWLQDEAIPAGGLGPNEADRILDRHLVDSVLFAAAWPGSAAPLEIVDLGSGVGLPGLPLALIWPDTTVTAVEKSGRRVDLLRRVARILGVENMIVEQKPIDQASHASMVTMRAVLPPERWEAAVVPLLLPGGVGVVAASVDHPRNENTLVIPPEATGSERVFQTYRT